VAASVWISRNNFGLFPRRSKKTEKCSPWIARPRTTLFAIFAGSPRDHVARKRMRHAVDALIYALRITVTPEEREREREREGKGSRWRFGMRSNYSTRAPMDDERKKKKENRRG
jgi:hypothetical protein